MSQLLEKLRMAAEVFAVPTVENEVSDDEKGVRPRRRWFRRSRQFTISLTGQRGN